MLVAKAKEQEGELCRLSQFQAHCSELQEQMEAAKAASLEYQQETQVCMYVPCMVTHIRTVCTYIRMYVRVPDRLSDTKSRDTCKCEVCT